MSNRGAFLKAVELFKSYLTGGKRLEVLRGVNLEIRQGELVAITGPSGVGKSTLLHLLGGLDRPTSGKILLAGEGIPFGRDRELARLRNQKIGFVFQFHHLLPELTALENVVLSALIGRRSLRVATEKAYDLLGMMGLSERSSHLPGELSCGENQRLAIVRALINEPEVLIADEPTGSLDRRMGEEVIEIIVELVRKRNLAAVLATHNEILAKRADRVFQLRDGQLEEV